MKHLNTFRPHLRNLLTGMVCAATALLAPACGKDSAASNGFFDEQGVWLLTQVQLDPDTQDSDTKPAAEDGFWMRFGQDKDGKLVVATAACGIEGDDDKKTAFHVMHTGCADENLDDKRIWQCNCYDYSFDDKTMVWTERKSKKSKKDEEEEDDLLALNLGRDDDDDSSEDEDDKSDKSDKEADKSEDEDEDKKEAEEELTSTAIKAHKSKNETYVFTGMPNFDNEDLEEDNEEGVFQSNGMTSKHTFSKRTIKAFKGTGCAKVCGIVDADEDEEDESDKEADKSDDESSDDDESEDDESEDE